MASRRGSSSKASYIFPATSDSETHFDPNLELYEADLWNYDSSSANNKAVTEAEPKKNKKKVHQNQPKRGGCKERLKNKRGDDDDDGDGGEGGGAMIPPHEYLARIIGTPNSVQEGKGRTLKGRDARNLRNDVWSKTGFEG